MPCDPKGGNKNIITITIITIIIITTIIDVELKVLLRGWWTPVQAATPVGGLEAEAAEVPILFGRFSQERWVLLIIHIDKSVL